MKEKRHRDLKRKTLHTGVSHSVIDITKGKWYSVPKYSSSQMCKKKKRQLPVSKCQNELSQLTV